MTWLPDIQVILWAMLPSFLLGGLVGHWITFAKMHTRYADAIRWQHNRDLILSQADEADARSVLEMDERARWAGL